MSTVTQHEVFYVGIGTAEKVESLVSGPFVQKRDAERSWYELDKNRVVKSDPHYVVCSNIISVMPIAYVYPTRRMS